MKVRLIYNPVSGNGVFRTNLDYIIERFQAKGIELVPFRTGDKGKMQQIISRLQEDGYDRVIVAGGDGTVNQVINCLLKHNVDIPLGIIPVGTANDFASYLKLHNDINEACNTILADQYTFCDVGQVNDDYFVNIASAGVLTDISQKTDLQLKNNLGKLAYYLKGIEELPNLRPFQIRIESAEHNFSGEVMLILIMNGKSAGGFRSLAPNASIYDGLLEVILLKPCSLSELMTLFMQIRTGEHMNHSKVLYFQSSSLKVFSDSDIITDLDGEKGPQFPVDVNCLSKRLKILSRDNSEYPEDTSIATSEDTFSFFDIKKMFEQFPTINVNLPNSFNQSKRNFVTDLSVLVKDLPRHNAFGYVNRGSLNKKYFDEAEQTLDNGYLYIILSSTGSAAGETIRRVTQKEYSHVSLSFDENLKTIISYNGGENIYRPGLNAEMIEFFCQKEDANVLIYKIPASKDQKKRVLDEIRNINQQGSSYNVLGLFFPYSHKKNIMFCSQFVYCMLKIAGLAYFEKQPEKVMPTDFIELDYERNLMFSNKIFHQRLSAKKIEEDVSMTDEASNAGNVEIRFFGNLKTLADEMGLPFPYIHNLTSECKALDLAKEIHIPTDMIEGVFINGVAKPIDQGQVKPGDRVGFIPYGIPGPYRVLLGFYKKKDGE